MLLSKNINKSLSDISSVFISLNLCLVIFFIIINILSTSNKTKFEIATSSIKEKFPAIKITKPQKEHSNQNIKNPQITNYKSIILSKFESLSFAKITKLNNDDYNSIVAYEIEPSVFYINNTNNMTNSANEIIKIITALISQANHRISVTIDIPNENIEHNKFYYRLYNILEYANSNDLNNQSLIIESTNLTNKIIISFRLNDFQSNAL